eukprot:5203099-Pyramimonas_sp.AAC.1
MLAVISYGKVSRVDLVREGLGADDGDQVGGDLQVLRASCGIMQQEVGRFPVLVPDRARDASQRHGARCAEDSWGRRP